MVVERKWSQRLFMSWESKAKWSQSCCNRNEIEIKRGAPRNSNHDDHDVERKEKRCHRYTHHDTYYVPANIYLLLLSSIRGRNKYSFHENKWRMLRQGPTQYQSHNGSRTGKFELKIAPRFIPHLDLKTITAIIEKMKVLTFEFQVLID